ncbi:MAG: hypothetical protein QM778_25135 [Myxococcales bacterium]
MRSHAQVLALGCLLAGCGSSASQEGAVESFSALHQDVFVQGGCVKCHDSDGPAGLDLSTPELAYHGLVGARAQGTKCAPSGSMRVAPGDSSASLLIHKLEGHDAANQPVCGKPMPQMERLASDEIERVRLWIDDGAESDL